MNHEISKSFERFSLLYNANLFFHLIAYITGITWKSYIAECGFEKFVASPRKAKLTFDNRFRFRGISWDGYVVKVTLNDDADPMS